MADWTTPDSVHSFCGEYGGYEATKSKDEDVETSWLHYTSCYHWIIFDMGETKKITKIRLYQYGETALSWGESKGLYVYVSDNLEDWGDAVWEGVLNAEGWDESGAFDKNGRYVKFVSKSNGILQRMYEFDAMAEAIGGETYTKTFTTDARILKRQPKTFTSDARLLKTLSQTFTADAYTTFRKTKTFTTDSQLLKRQPKTFTSDAKLLKRIVKTFTSDAILEVAGFKGIDTDALLLKRMTKTFSADALLTEAQLKGFAVDGLLLKRITATFSADAILESAIITKQTFKVDAILLKRQTATFTIDAYLTLPPYVAPPPPIGMVAGRYKNPCIILTVDGHVLLNINMKKPQYLLIN